MEWLFFLLPLAALSGWLAARNHYKKRYAKQSSPFNPDYFKGLNYLLNEQPDKAIDVFIRLLEVNSETVETHLALANLFRKRGETDRAIRIHQNLIARPTLTQQQRNLALAELGLDYMNAGVLDRAEHLFLELLNSPSPPFQAFEQLLRIYEQEKDWPKAIEMAKKIQAQGKKNLGPVISQFYCELAEKTSQNSTSTVLELIKHAHANDPNCVRATLIEANVHINANKFRKALKFLLHIEQQNYLYLPESLPLLLKCYQQLNKLDAFESWLHALLKRHPNMTSARIMLADVIQQQYGGQKAQDYLHQQLQEHPSIEGLHTLISLGEPSNPILVPLIQGITTTLVRRGHRYTCPHCGFSGKKLHWHCPGCKRWGTIRPTEIHLSALETLLEPSHE
ncbi:MAG: lipopolysaccharide assembly protein LapB [Methylophaga sp.]|nr:lipopolysaccharide assembly protein LapB [Methylophaga sp.]